MSEKRVRRLITHPETKTLRMVTLFEYPAKVGTQGSTVVWTIGRPKAGKPVFGYCLEDRYTPYMGGQAFRYAQATRFFVSSIQHREEGDFLTLSR